MKDAFFWLMSSATLAAFVWHLVSIRRARRAAPAQASYQAPAGSSTGSADTYALKFSLIIPFIPFILGAWACVSLRGTTLVFQIRHLHPMLMVFGIVTATGFGLFAFQRWAARQASTFTWAIPLAFIVAGFRLSDFRGTSDT